MSEPERDAIERRRNFWGSMAEGLAMGVFRQAGDLCTTLPKKRRKEGQKFIGSKKCAGWPTPPGRPKVGELNGWCAQTPRYPATPQHSTHWVPSTPRGAPVSTTPSATAARPVCAAPQGGSVGQETHGLGGGVFHPSGNSGWT